MTTSTIGQMPKRGRLICLIGVSGIGKSSFTSYFPAPYFVIDHKETGIVDLIESGQCQHLTLDNVRYPGFDNMQELLNFNQSILGGSSVIPPDRRTLVYESITGFEELARNLTCRTKFNNDFGTGKNGYYFMNFGPKTTAGDYWGPFITQLCNIREMGYNVVLTGHSDIVTVRNPKGPDYLSEYCRCTKEDWTITHGFFENIFFLTFDVHAEKEDKFARGKASASVRYLYCYKTPYVDAKNRCGIDDRIDAGSNAYDTYLGFCRSARPKQLDPQTLQYL